MNATTATVSLDEVAAKLGGIPAWRIVPDPTPGTS